MKNKNILVLEGGHNEEHEVSLASAKEVKKAILELNYNLQSLEVNPINFEEKIKDFKVDVCFNALHGPFGEDGNIQKILFKKKINYTHSGVQASKKAFDKILTKRAIKNTGIIFPNSVSIKKSNLNDEILKKMINKFGSIVLKPVSSGSSFGVQLIKSEKEIKFFFEKKLDKKLYKNHYNLMIEPYIKGKELTVVVLGEKNISEAIEVTEIVSKNKFFDYEAKYTKGFSKHILPAKIPNQIYKKCLENAKIVHDTLGCSGVSRSDFLYDEKNNNIFFLEINTQPGLTPVSLVPEQLKYNNINFIKLIDKLIRSSSCLK